MSVEVEEVTGFLAEHEPFSHLPSDALTAISASMTMRYIRRGTTVVEAGQRNDTLHVIRSGAMDVLDSEGGLLDRREPGLSFGYSTLVADPGVAESCYTTVAVEDSLILELPREAFQRAAAEHPDIERFYSLQTRQIRSAAQDLADDAATGVLRTPLRDVMIVNPQATAPETSIAAAAQQMREQAVSSLLITADGALRGIVTDRDMTGRVVAQSLDTSLPVSEVMTRDLRTVTPETLAFEAMLLMAELKIHHLPVLEEGKVVGVVAGADIARLLRVNPIYLTADFSRRTSREELRDAYREACAVIARFLDRSGDFAEAAQMMTIAADSIARRLLELAEEQFGAPPVPYAFVVLGSQGRREMGLSSDQDNAMVLSNDYNPNQHGEYFANLARWVCEGLAEAGQAWCPGDMMATNPLWRQTARDWEDTFHSWITAPDADALLHAQTFFDFRPVYGDTALANEVHRTAVRMGGESKRLHAHLASLAARREPPLTFFKGLVVERSGDYARTLNIKTGGTYSIVQMARLYAIASGVDAVDTATRLELSAGAGVSKEGARDLADAFYFLRTLTLRHQGRKLRHGEQPDYHVDPKRLSKMDREHLRDSFQVIKRMQSALGNRYPVRSIS
ncbi:DUF294 nucleotidyltransferase-like domain-containing protein [Corynebacterium pseudodiphtheriticum]|uniref:DUF294 nucleotidyltransferase-like domain-containing protein n=1 Tax=Corynebacterium pseudodiphtheriticum TaxID=37637 RepID=A0AAP4F4V6_9CORY|nr:DUF294 nucleotidyltransferase-like domain-containing protein [Corynebacterium pseudodiphtheriticum]MDK4227839.1 DUF294 nucleotidyltransferase-like domain-containing protein [Corynebacterium pseudodiphtheriticum]MDK4306179.1 DUF294 nucleotidyltransferase-like domain-containing protein [Corynebacterium pseudodiphtheriticum]